MLFDQNHFPEGVFLSHYPIARPINWQEQFGNDFPLHLEIGFGFGEFLIQQAGFPVKENLIGVEQDWSRICKCLSKVSSLRETSVNRVFGENLRLMRVDATVALERLFIPHSLNRVTCLFPCPWPKKGHVKHRLFSHDFLSLLNSRLKNDALVEIVTDWPPYLEWILEQMNETGFQSQVETISPQFNTKFERKWQAGGQNEFWKLTLKKINHHDVGVKEDVELRALFVKDFNPERFHLENVVGETSIIYKDFVFDARQNLGLVRLIVAEKFLTQHVWVAIIKTRDQWCVAKADGHNALPTSGVALAIERVSEAAVKTTTLS